PYRESHRNDDQQPQIDQKLFHHPALNASTMFKRIARSAGASPTNRPKASISAMPVSQVSAPTAWMGTMPPLAAEIPGTSTDTRPRPITPPSSNSSTLS